MGRFLIILALPLLTLATWFFGPFLSVGDTQPLAPTFVRAGVSLVLLLVALGLAIGALVQHRRKRAKAAPQTARENFRAAWRSIGLLGAPIAFLAGTSIWVIEGAYRNITQINAEMRDTLDTLRTLDPGQTLSDLAATNTVLTEIYGFSIRDESGLNLPLLDPETDRIYLNDHYELMVSNHLRPHLMQRLEDKITSSLGKADALYEALKVYLMLGQEGAMDADYALDWVEADLSELLPGAFNQALREELILHTATLLRSERWNEYPVRADLVAQARQQLAQIPEAALLYYRIMSDPVITALPDWRVSVAGGPATSRVFMRASGKPLSQGIPGIFTRDGFQEVFLPLLSSSAGLQARDAWILGPQKEGQTNDLEALVAQDTLQLYYSDFIKHWEGLLGDLTLVPIETPGHLVEVMNVVSGPISPVANILQAAADETRLTRSSSEGQQTIALDAVKTNLSQRLGRLAVLRPASIADASLVAPGGDVEERFKWLHQLVDGAPPTFLDAYMAELTQVYRAVNRLSFQGVAAPHNIDVVDAPLRALSVRMPPLIESWTLQMLGGLGLFSGDSLRASLNAKWQSQILPFCQQAISGRYPFDRRAQAEVALEDFSRLFGPGGLIDGFFNENLAGFVDRTSRPWTWRSDAGLSSEALLAFQRAAEIRDAFFLTGSNIQINFQITPVALDHKALSVTFVIGNQEVIFRQSELPRPSAMTWPQSERVATILMEKSTGMVQLQRDGAWALFRLLDAMEIRRTNVSDRLRLVTNVDGLIAVFELQVGSVVNPFTTTYEGSNFSCPKGL